MPYNVLANKYSFEYFDNFTAQDWISKYDELGEAYNQGDIDADQFSYFLDKYKSMMESEMNKQSQSGAIPEEKLNIPLEYLKSIHESGYIKGFNVASGDSDLLKFGIIGVVIMLVLGLIFNK